MPKCQASSLTDNLNLLTERLGPLPIVNHFLQRLGVQELFGRYVASQDRRCVLQASKGLGVLLRSLVLEREPIYRHYETVNTFSISQFGLSEDEAGHLDDDHLGRALDSLFDADRGSLLTELVVRATREFGIQLNELHNDSTTVKFTGQYRAANGRSIRGKRAPWIRFGFSKDHRPDLKQLLVVMTTSSDGGIPIQFRSGDGNTNDSTTHIETWNSLVKVTGDPGFLYTGDSKLCCYETMRHIDRNGGRLVTVMPRSRLEDGQFRKWIQKNEPSWEIVWDRRNPRVKHGPRDRWYVYRPDMPSQEGWPITWVWSTLLALHHRRSRSERLAAAQEELQDLDRRLQGPRPRLRSHSHIAQEVDDTLDRHSVKRYLRVEIWYEQVERFLQTSPGRPGPHTRYQRQLKPRQRLRWTIDQQAVAYDEKTDGMYPLLTNDRSLTPREILEAHKRQPTIEKRFQQLKSVMEIAPVFLKNEGRIEALFLLFFIGLLIQTLIQREVRLAMEDSTLPALPIYPEERPSKRPTAEQILRLFSPLERHTLRASRSTIRVFPPELTDTQRLLLRLLDVPQSVYINPSPPIP